MTEPARIVLAQGETGLDVGAPHHPRDARRAPAGTLLVDPGVDPGSLLVGDAAGGWRVHPDWFWACLQPLSPATPPADQALAAAWRGLRRWRDLPAEELTACRQLCLEHAREAATVIDIIGRVAGAGPPEGAAGGVDEPGDAPGAAATSPSLPELSDPRAVADWVADPEGLGALYGDDFWPRPQQAELAAAVARALQDGQALLAEAGTGTGKTLAYLVALLARLGENDERAVISTYSRTLQQQVLAGDLPRLIGRDAAPTARLLMGRGNYLCLRQRNAYLTRPRESGRDALVTVAFRLWLQATADGLREELTEHPLLADACPQLFSSVQPCTPDCHADGRCFVTRARRLARQARIVVVNHALLLADHASGGALLGPHEHLLIDEAHRLPGATLDAATVRLDHWRLRGLEDVVGPARGAAAPPEAPALLAVRLARDAEESAASRAARTTAEALGRAMRSYSAWWRNVGRAVRPPAGAAPGQRARVADKDVAFAGVRDETVGLLAALAEAAGAVARLNQLAEDLDDPPGDVLDLLLRCAQAGQLVQTLERDVRFVTSDPTDRWVTWLEPGSEASLTAVGATPLASGPLLREIWQDQRLAPVATSATLAVSGDFGFMLEALGLAGRRPRAATVDVPSPFAWQEHARCLAPEDMPDPDAPGFPGAVAELLAGLRREVPRQTLVLFTSYRLLQDVADRVATLPAGTAGPLLVQRPRVGADVLRERFRRERGAMLLGTATFWEGVDFPGASLEVVVVTKLPFLVPSDPWVAARCEQLRTAGEDPFRSFMLRDAVLRLRQGVGRLLRRRDDRGVILLLDNRLITRPYGTTFRDALPTAVRWLPQARQLATAAREFLTDGDRGSLP
jgi:Rad3-related DNA helicase